MSKLIAALFLFVAFQPGQRPAAPPPAVDAPPALSVSQGSAILMLEHRRLELEPKRDVLRHELTETEGLLVSVHQTEALIASEFARQHPGWRLDGKTFQPVRDSGTPAAGPAK